MASARRLHIYVPFLKPAPSTLAAELWALNTRASTCRASRSFQHHGLRAHVAAVDPLSTRISIGASVSHVRKPGRPHRYPGASRRSHSSGAGMDAGRGQVPARGAFSEGRAFCVTPAMTSLLGASGEDMAVILKGLGYRMERRPKPPEPVVEQASASPEATAASSPETLAAVESEALSASEPGEPIPDTPPPEEPPVQEPTIEPPADEPPVTPPSEEPPIEEPHPEAPPVEEPPVVEPSIEPPAQEPSMQDAAPLAAMAPEAGGDTEMTVAPCRDLRRACRARDGRCLAACAALPAARAKEAARGRPAAT